MHLAPEHAIGHYKRSKILAEQVALRFCQQGLPVVIVNPAAPIGPWDIKPTPTGKIIVDFLQRKMPAYVDTGLNLVDVRDVALAHVRAMQLEEAGGGKRFILWVKTIPMNEMGRIIKDASPASVKKRIPTKKPSPLLPRPLIAAYVRLTDSKELSTFVSTTWKKAPTFDVSLSKDILKIEYRDAESSIRDTVEWCVENKKY